MSSLSRRAFKAMLRTVMTLLTLTTSVAGTAGHAASLESPVEQPRPFGYFIGDMVSQTVALPAGLNASSAITLPESARLNQWFERIDSRIVTTANDRRWIEIRTQIINSPAEPLRASLPAISIDIPGHGPVQIPAWSLAISPLGPGGDSTADGGRSIRPDKPATLLIHEPLPGRFQRWLWALALVMAGWMIWLLWRNRTDRNRLPFEQAWHAIRGLQYPAQRFEAWQQLHQAFNQTAGRTVQLAQIDQLFSSAPFLAAQRTRIEHFYRASNDCFFARDAIDLSQQHFDLRGLCLVLRGLEKRSTR